MLGFWLLILHSWHFYTTLNAHYVSYDHISCNGTALGYLDDSVAISFNNIETQNVTITNCDSQFDTQMVLRDSDDQVISYSVCLGGDDCYDAIYPCATPYRETFTMLNLTQGNYTIVLESYNGEAGDYVVQVFCSLSPNISAESVSCGESASGYVSSDLSQYTSIPITFSNPMLQDVTFTNCGTTYETKMQLLNQSDQVISDSVCDGGNGCNDANYPCLWNNEAFTMNALSEGEYTIMLELREAYGELSELDFYSVRVLCSLSSSEQRSSSVSCGGSGALADGQSCNLICDEYGECAEDALHCSKASPCNIECTGFGACSTASMASNGATDVNMSRSDGRPPTLTYYARTLMRVQMLFSKVDQAPLICSVSEFLKMIGHATV